MNRTVTFVFVLCVMGALFTLFCAPTPSPEQYAAATATVLRAYARATAEAYYNESLAQANYARQTASAGEAFATATAVAVSAEATRTAVALSAQATAAAAQWQLQATATPWAIAIQATRTAVPYDATLIATRTETENAKAWLGVGAFALILVSVALIVTAIRAILIRESKTIRRDKSGQLPVLLQDGAVTNPARMLGSTVVVRADPLTQLARVVTWLRTGTLPPPGAPLITETDHGASPEQLLDVARAELTATGLAAMFQPGLPSDERRERIRQMQDSGALPHPTRTQIVVNGADAFRAVMDLIRPQLGATPPAPVLLAPDETNAEHRTPNSELRTPNSEQETTCAYSSGSSLH